MTDRGIIKWQPFQSCYSQRKIVDEITKKKSYHSFPVLSDDQFEIIQKKLINSYHLQEVITIYYFYSGQTKTIQGKINSINFSMKQIYINNSVVYFEQIVEVL